MNDYIKNIVEVCNNRASGKLHLKMFFGEVACIDKIEKILPKEIGTNETDISIGLCSRFVDKMREHKFFGELNFNFINGKITGIEVSKIYKLSDVEIFLS